MRLYRPHIPLKVRVQVAERQIMRSQGLPFWRRRREESNAAWLQELLAYLFPGKDFHLDHDPALATRKRRGEGKATVYTPAANDPDYLIYREKHDHHIKTNVRGEHGQHPDRVLIKRARREREKATDKSKRKMKWPKRPLRSASRWPKRNFQRRKFSVLQPAKGNV